MRFREFKEVENNIEKERVTDKKCNNYLNIKPENDLTIEECNDLCNDLFWNSIFSGN